ncbi:DNA translocase FtsK, partial [Bosea sp. Root381]|uniref:DNA translocase FtsK n=1 Tax=Bosea sp. Root381 TaxID=1736524 RepID=UPI00244EC6B1
MAAEALAVRPEPAQVRFWRTPDRFIDQVWTKKRQPEGPNPAQAEVAADLELDRGDYCEQGEVEAESSRCSEGEGALELPEADVPEPAPFAFLSDHAFWEGLGDPLTDLHDDALAQSPRAEVPELPAAPPRGGAVAVDLRRAAASRPIAESVPSPMPASVAASVAAPVPTAPVGWSAPQSYRVSLNFAARPWTAPVQDEGREVEEAASPAEYQAQAPVAGRGVVVTRRARDEIAAHPSRPPAIAVTVADLPLVQPAPFELPPMSFLAEPPQALEAVPVELLQQNAGLLEGVLEDFNIRGEIVQACPGPVVTLYELEPAPGIKSSRVISLADDIARSMSAISARVAVVQGKNAIG